jgi:hypothetical protein
MDPNSQKFETPQNIVGRILEIRGKSRASTRSEVAGAWVGVITGARRLGWHGRQWAALGG